MMIKNLLPDVVRTTRADLDQPFYSLQKEMNNLFDSFFRGLIRLRVDSPDAFLKLFLLRLM